MADSIDHVKVAVRVRPFNSREKQRSAKCIIQMEGSTTLLLNPNLIKESPKKFTFDFSYWSHDGFTPSSDAMGLIQPDLNQVNGTKYADQETVYNDLGKDLLNNAFEGYNAALFAYGQTGSGKSYSIIGYGSNRGIVPRFCDELFETISHQKNSGANVVFEVTLSMMEIYNELVRDLLNPMSTDGAKRKKGLRVRENPNSGFYAEGLKSFPVTNRHELAAKIEEGTTSRSIAATNMNETSSRAHTIVVVSLTQTARNPMGEQESRTSSINLVDLAGSERLSGTQATGDRLKEGVSINQSLSCLGNCIHALAEKSAGKNIRVPFRESVLTRLLMNALGGNSKTVMVATISPADINYEETLSTLRYADRAKQIKVHATVNQTQTEELVARLREENERLKQLMASSSMPSPSGSLNEASVPTIKVEDMRKRWEEEMNAALEENEKQLIQMRLSYEEKLVQQAASKTPVSTSLVSIGSDGSTHKEKKNHPYLSNLNFDEQLSGKIVHILHKGDNILGKGADCEVKLYGPRIHDRHGAIYRKESGVCLLEPETDECRILLNGDLITNKVTLNHNDRLLFGTNQLFVFAHPEQSKKSNLTYADVSFELAQEEIASKAGYTIDHQDATIEVALLNKDLMEILPSIDEANAISEELDKNTRFELLLVAPQILGLDSSDRTEVYIKVICLDTGLEFEWKKDKFLNRLYLMREMYQNFEAGEEWELNPERDPFLDDPSTESLIGSSQLFLQPLAYMVEVKEQLELVDYRRFEVGIVNVEIIPCSSSGVEFTEEDDAFVDSPSELIGRDVHFAVKIMGCRGLPARYTQVYCRYNVYLDKESSRTDVISDTSNPDFNHKKVFSFQPVTQQLADYLKDGTITFHVWGKQISKRARSRDGKGGGGTPSALGGGGGGGGGGLQEDLMAQTNGLMDGFKMNGRLVEPSQQSIIVELLLMKKQTARQQQKIENLRRLVDVSEKVRKQHIPTQMVKDLLATTTQDVADDIIGQIPLDREYQGNKSTTCTLS